ncbi:uncharacterized protein [Palaemon carinicauda]|uniref:uncharacterized protein isoform X2 n=1 Tax=Palaemon carinicauda TaxID=392227 RepID=UPI0035B5A424
MKPPTHHHALVHALFLILAVGHMTQDALAYHAGTKNHHHDVHHHQGHHEGHHHSATHHGHHHGGRAARTRREKDNSSEAATSPGHLDSLEEEQIQCSENTACSGLERSYCDTSKSVCVCPVDYPIADYVNGHCVAEAKLDTGCNFDSECDAADQFSYCGQGNKCVCKEGYIMEEYPNVGFSCVTKNPQQGPGQVDPAMIGVLVGLALMFVIICVVLRLFSKARFRENRSIFNTPNPRLMNASLFKDSKLLSPARGERRGSRASVRAPSRAASVTSVNAATRSPNGSLAKGRRGSAMSAVSATGSVAPSGGAAPKTPSPAKESKNKSETTVAIENVD